MLRGELVWYCFNSSVVDSYVFKRLKPPWFRFSGEGFNSSVVDSGFSGPFSLPRVLPRRLQFFCGRFTVVYGVRDHETVIKRFNSSVVDSAEGEICEWLKEMGEIMLQFFCFRFRFVVLSTSF